MTKKHVFDAIAPFSLLLHSLNQKRPIPAPWCPPPGHGQSTWLAFCPSLSHQWATVGSDLLPHAPGTATLVFPAARRPNVLVSMCCLWLEHKYLPGEHHHELSRRMLSTWSWATAFLPQQSTAFSHTQFNLRMKFRETHKSWTVTSKREKRNCFFQFPFALTVVQQRPLLPWL